ncbi:MAG: hypothetical protein ABL984_03670 [Pyrinomonadaceae bacterium]
MNDIKNIFIAWISTSTSLFAAIELKTVLSILSAIVLPIVFFSIGKTVDVLLQIYFRRKESLTANNVNERESSFSSRKSS